MAFTFTCNLPYIASLFIYTRKIYVRKHVKITRQWKYTLADNNLSSQIIVLYIIYIMFSSLKDGKKLTWLTARFCRILIVLMPLFKKRLIESWNVPDTYRDLVLMALSRKFRHNTHLLCQRWFPCCYQRPQMSVHRKLLLFIFPRTVKKEICLEQCRFFFN